MPGVYFGNASAEYPRGPVRNWQTGVTLRRRPEQQGADVGTFGKEPRRFAMPAIIFATTTVEIDAEEMKWEARVGERDTLYVDDSGVRKFPGITLVGVHKTTGVRRMVNATNSKNWYMWITVVFARTKETTE